MRTFLLLALLLLPQPGSQPSFAQSQKEALIVRKHPDMPDRLICELRQATFTAPEGWQPYQSSRATACLLAPKDEKPGEFSMSISIDIGKSPAPDSKALAEAWAKPVGAKVDETAIKLDGAEAYRVTAPANGELKPIEAWILIKDKRAYMIIGGAKKDSKELSKALNEIQETWKWKPE